MTFEDAPMTEHRILTDALKALTGADFEAAEDHPGVLLDLVTDDNTVVYGWWPANYNTPVLAWQSPRGWSATIVDSDDLGWPDNAWYDRARDLGSAFLDAPEPTTVLDLLRTACAAAANPDFADHWREKNKALAWGLLRLLNLEVRLLGTHIAAGHGLDLTGAGEALLDGMPLPDAQVQRDDLLIEHPASTEAAEVTG